MRGRRKGSRLYLTLALVLIIAIAISSVFIKETRGGFLHEFKNRARDIATYPLSTVKKGYTSIENWLLGVFRAAELREENLKLRNELKNARRTILEAQDLKKENEELRTLLELKKRNQKILCFAEIIAINQELSGKFYTVDKGTADGVEENMPVITPDGVFGKVYSAGKSSSIVIPVNHPLSAVSARVAETSERGIVEGSTDGKLYLRFIPRESKVSIGMVVVTSGLGGVYPEGVLIGTIKSIKDDPNSLDLQIEVGPAVNFLTTDFVIIMKSPLSAPEKTGKKTSAAGISKRSTTLSEVLIEKGVRQ